MSISKGIGFSLVAFFVLHSVFPQEAKFQTSLSLSYETGPMLSNGTEWGNQIKSAVDFKALVFKVGWRKISNTSFNYLYRYPTLGFGFNTALKYYEEIG